MRPIEMKLIATGLVTAGLFFGTAGLAAASSDAHIKETLTATTGAPTKAGGKASLSLQKKPGKATKGSFAVTVKRLDRSSSYDLIVDGVKISTITTNSGGSGRGAFNTKPRGTTALLGFDPRGSTVVLRDASGTDVLVGTIPDDSPGSHACCLATTDQEGETECEDVSDCAAAGGTVPMITNPDGTQTPVASCLPDPCNPNSPQPGNVVIACCINTTHGEGTESECQDYTETECATKGGMAVQVLGATAADGNPCDLNPCQISAPPSTPPALCCVPHTSSDGGAEPAQCEDLTPEACAAAGGTPPSNGTCDSTVPCQ